jgi:hypothetical protein
MSIDGISNISGITSRPVEVTDITSKVNEQNSGPSFFHVLKDIASDETFLFRTENGNVGGLVNFKDSPEDIAEVLSKNQFVKIQENPDMPAHLKNGISLIA